MSILDQQLLFAGSYTAGGTFLPQLVTAIGATNGQNVIDAAVGLGNQAADLGGRSRILFQIKQTLTSAGSPTVQFQWVQADDQALSTNVQVLNQTDAYPIASLPVGTIVPLGMNRGAAQSPYPGRRYLGVRFVVAGAVLTNASGQFMASIGGEGSAMSAVAPIYRGAIGIV